MKGRHLAAALAMCVAASFAAAPAADPGERLLYARADVLTMVTGETSLRRAYTRQIELPSETCEGGAFTCVGDRAYRQVYALDFVEETVSRGTDGKAIVNRRERGRLTIALDLPKESETRFEDALLAHIGQLDIVMVAVDGAYTMDVAGVVETLKTLRARLVLPMHYFETYTLNRFLDRIRGDFAVEMSRESSIVVSQASLPAEPKVLVLPGR